MACITGMRNSPALHYAKTFRCMITSNAIRCIIATAWHSSHQACLPAWTQLRKVITRETASWSKLTMEAGSVLQCYLFALQTHHSQSIQKQPALLDAACCTGPALPSDIAFHHACCTCVDSVVFLIIAVPSAAILPLVAASQSWGLLLQNAAAGHCFLSQAAKSPGATATAATALAAAPSNHTSSNCHHHHSLPPGADTHCCCTACCGSAAAVIMQWTVLRTTTLLPCAKRLQPNPECCLLNAPKFPPQPDSSHVTAADFLPRAGSHYIIPKWVYACA